MEIELSKEYSLEDYSLPAIIADLSILDRDAVMRYIHRGEESARVIALIAKSRDLHEYIEKYKVRT